MGNTTTRKADVRSAKQYSPADLTLKTRIKIHVLVVGSYGLIISLYVLVGGFYG